MRSSFLSKLFALLGMTTFAASFLVVQSSQAQFQIFNPFASGKSSSVSTIAAPQTLMDTEDRIVETVKNTEPAVASVIITKELPKMERSLQTIPFKGQIPGLNDDFFQQFNIQIPQYRQNGTQKTEVGGGTAFFVTSDGLMITNKHVVSDTSAEYTVLLNDGQKLTAKVVARDPVNDIALLKVSGSRFTPLSIAASDDLHLGQTAIAIGNALGQFRNTVSVGVVSGQQRSINAGDRSNGQVEQLTQIIQTDAAINEGNSGGPLLNSRGEVIGMNTAIAEEGNGIGFALPAKELRRALQSYQTNGRIVSAYLGVRYIPITPDLQTQNKLSYAYGVLLSRGETAADPAVIPGSPADKAGLMENDIILQADGVQLIGDVSLASIIQSKNPGDTLKLHIVHQGKEKDVTVTLGEFKE